MGGAKKDVDAPTGEMQGKSDEPVEELDASIQEPVKKTQEPTQKRTSKKMSKSKSRNSQKHPSRKPSSKASRRARMPNNDIKTDIKKSDTDIKKKGNTNHDRLPVRQRHSGKGTSSTSKNSGFPRGTQRKGNTKHVHFPKIRVVLRRHPSPNVRHRASSSSGTPATSPSLTASTLTALTFSSRGNDCSPSTTSSSLLTLALPRPLSLQTCSGHSPRSALSSPPARASTTSTWPSAGGSGLRSPAQGAQSQRQCSFGESTSRERQLPHGGLPSHDIESGSPQGESTYAHSLDHARSQQRFAIPHASLFELNLVAAGLLIDGLLSQVKDPVRYVLIFLFVLGFLGFLVGESIRSPTIRGTGSVATVFAFLITMLLLVIHKS